MARPLRIEVPGGVYHITSRGNRRGSIFIDDVDRRAFLEVLSSVVNRFAWVCHAYCLMGNHYHMLVETPDPNLSRGMHWLNGVFTQRFNRRHAVVGHLFQGRYGAVLVQKDGHLMESIRYVVLNPVRAGLVRSPGEWKWSSYRATSGAVTAPSWLTTDWVLAQFGSTRGVAVRAYEKFVLAGASDNRPGFSGNADKVVIGDERFVATIASDVAIRDAKLQVEFVRRERHVGRPSLETLLPASRVSTKASRNDSIRAACFDHAYTMVEIARHLGLHYSTVSRIVNKKRNA